MKSSDGMGRTFFMLIALTSALLGCSARSEMPKPGEPSLSTAGWRSETYVQGLTFTVPREAKIARPEGVDSILLTIRGHGYSIDLDDFGGFGGTPNATFAGAPAIVESAGTPSCGSRTISVKLANPSLLVPPLCDDLGNCSRQAGVARILARCIPNTGCATMEAILASARFAPAPYPPNRAPEPNFDPGGPICRVSQD